MIHLGPQRRLPGKSPTDSFDSSPGGEPTTAAPSQHAPSGRTGGGVEGKHNHELNCKSRGPAWKLVDYGNSRQGGPLDLQLSWCLCSHSLSNPAWGRKPFVRAIPPDGRGGLMFIATVFLKSKPKLKNTWLKAPVRCSRISAVAPGATASGTPPRSSWSPAVVLPRRAPPVSPSTSEGRHPRAAPCPGPDTFFPPPTLATSFF